MLTRKLGKIVFGKATPSQIMIGCIIGALLGFMPGFHQAPGLIALLVVLLVVLNTPLPLAGVVGMLAKLIALAVAPLSFGIGRLLLDGPTQPIFQTLINAPVLAYFGFDYYLVTGGMVIGLLVGIAAGVGVIKGVTVIRKKMAGLEENSERYRQWTSKFWVRTLLFLLAGGIPKQGFKSLLEKRKFKPFRPLGLVIVAGLIAVAVLLQMLLAEPIVTYNVRTALERANGATVDLERAELELRRGRVTLHNLAMADPNALDTDLLRAAELEAQISMRDLLRKRLTLDRVIVVEGRQGETRQIPGRRTRPRRPAPDVPPREGEKTLEDYLAEAEQWKQRLAQLQDWLDRVSRAEETDPDHAEPGDPNWRERLEQRVAERGYANVRAHHLITGRPTLTIVDLQANAMRTAALPDEAVDVRGEHLSTHPHLNDHPPRISITSSLDSLRLQLNLASLAADVDSTVDFHLRNLSVDNTIGQLAGNLRPLSQGTMDLTLNGAFATAGGVFLDLPLQVIVRDSVVRVPGGQSAQVEQLNVPLGLRGPVANPRITLDDNRLAEALRDAGAAALASRVQQEADRALDRVGSQLQDRIGVPLIGREREGERDAEQNGDARQRLQDQAGDALRGILPRGNR